MIITLRQLKAKGACVEQVIKFDKLFGSKIEVTLDLCLKHASDFSWDWASQNLLSASAYKAYDEATATARKAYYEALEPAWKANYEARETARKAYYEATATARKAYYEAMAPAQKAFDEAMAPAQKAFDEARATAFFHALQMGA